MLNTVVEISMIPSFKASSPQYRRTHPKECTTHATGIVCAEYLVSNIERVRPSVNLLHDG